jgi:hypothetical protein
MKNVSASASVKNPVVNDRSNRVEVHACFAGEQVERDKIVGKEVSTDKEVAADRGLESVETFDTLRLASYGE